MKNNHIFITGPFCSGKERAALLLVKHFGYEHVSLRNEIVTYARSIGLGLGNRNEMRWFARLMRKHHGGDFFLKMAYEKEGASNKKLAIESIWDIEEVNFLKNIPFAKLISIDADSYQRYLLSQYQGSLKEGISFERFKLQEQQEMKEDALEYNIKYCMEHSDISLERDANTQTFDRLFISTMDKLLFEI